MALCNVILVGFQAKQACPMSSYADDTALLKRIGVNAGGAYHSHEGGTQINQSIAPTPSTDLRENLKSVELRGLLFDRSEDIIVFFGFFF